MGGLAKRIGCLLLASSAASCTSVTLQGWASDKAPRSEVLGFVDRGGDGDYLLARLQGEDGFASGLYEVPVVPQAGELLPRPLVRLDADGWSPASPQLPSPSRSTSCCCRSRLPHCS